MLSNKLASSGVDLIWVMNSFKLWVLVSARNVQKYRHSAHDSALQLVLLMLLLLDWVGLNLGGAGQLQWLHQLVLILGRLP